MSTSLNGTLPVFRGLDEVAIQGKEIAAIVGVTAPTFSKWRSERAKIPESKLVFLTLLLAHWLDEMENQQGYQGQPTNPKRQARQKTTCRCLLQQEAINQALPPEAVREGSRLFRQWWFQDGERTGNNEHCDGTDQPRLRSA